MLNIQIFMKDKDDIHKFKLGIINGKVAAIDNGKAKFEYTAQDGDATFHIYKKSERTGEFEEERNFPDNSIFIYCETLSDIASFMIEDNPVFNSSPDT